MPEQTFQWLSPEEVQEKLADNPNEEWQERGTSILEAVLEEWDKHKKTEPPQVPESPFKKFFLLYQRKAAEDPQPKETPKSETPKPAKPSEPQVQDYPVAQADPTDYELLEADVDPLDTHNYPTAQAVPSTPADPPVQFTLFPAKPKTTNENKPKRERKKKPSALPTNPKEVKPLPDLTEDYRQRDLYAEGIWQETPHTRWQAYGGIVFDQQGRVLLREPTNHYEGYVWTFPAGGYPKGKNNGESPVDTALREVAEESGHKGKIVGAVPGTYAGKYRAANYYLMESTGENANLMDQETANVRWATPEEARQLLAQSTNQPGRERDLMALEMAVKEWDRLGSERSKEEEPPSKGSPEARVALEKSMDAVMSRMDELVQNNANAAALPEKWEPFSGKSPTDYGKTHAITLYLQEKRTEDILKERGLSLELKQFPHLNDKAYFNFNRDVWEEWKISSTTTVGWLLQVATADELNGEIRPLDKAAQKKPDFKDIEHALDSQFGEDSYGILKAYVRATWEASQYVLRKAGIEEFPVWRGLMLPTEMIEEAGKEEIYDFTKLPNMHLLKNGIASATSKPDVANRWKGIGRRKPKHERVVMRIMVPRAAALSLPVFGINQFNEEEVTVVGVDWGAVDFWYDTAPEDIEKHPIVEGGRKKGKALDTDHEVWIDINELTWGQPNWLSEKEAPPQIRPTPFRKFFTKATHTGPKFTGPIQDASGRHMCFGEGKRVPCEQFGGSGEGWAQLRGQEDLYDALRRLVDEVKLGNHDGWHELLGVLTNTPEEALQVLKEEHQLYAPRDVKPQLVQLLQTELGHMRLQVGTQMQGKGMKAGEAPKAPEPPKPPKQPSVDDTIGSERPRQQSPGWTDDTTPQERQQAQQAAPVAPTPPPTPPEEPPVEPLPDVLEQEVEVEEVGPGQDIDDEIGNWMRGETEQLQQERAHDIEERMSQVTPRKLSQIETQGFLPAIKSEPQDDMPRLYYADWLEEQGNEALATFIRYQIKTNGMNRIYLEQIINRGAESHGSVENAERLLQQLDQMTELEEAHPEWFWPWGRGNPREADSQGYAHFNRGMLSVSAPAEEFSRIIQESPERALAMVENVKLSGRPHQIGNLLLRSNMQNVSGNIILPWLQHISSLDLSDNTQLGRFAHSVSSYLSNEPSANLRELHLRQTRIGSDAEGGAIRHLANSPHLNNLTLLDLSHNNLSNVSIEMLVNTTGLQGLQQLDLRGNDISVVQLDDLRERFPNTRIHHRFNRV